MWSAPVVFKYIPIFVHKEQSVIQYILLVKHVILALYRDPGGTLNCVAKDTQDARTSKPDPFLKTALWKCAKS